MFNNIQVKKDQSANITQALVDGDDVRYHVTFVSDGATCAIGCGVFHKDEPGNTQAFDAAFYNSNRWRTTL